ncbi:hypothetical protein [Burkholderia gladioli]|uniref:hypothetical protein n=1 Tax=Burkholderia gladioli TaxID=28095 RepID=UPI0016411C9F|nr:hypothetical protein [Burkholderia gladioli]
MKPEHWCRQGVYADREVAGQALDMLPEGTEREAPRQALTPQHCTEIARYLTNYDLVAPRLQPHAH